MSTLLEVLSTELGLNRGPVLVEEDHCVWMRASDLVVGLVRCSPSGADATISSAYDQLDASGKLRASEIWNVLLVVELLGEDDDPEVTAKIPIINADLKRSRKLAKMQNAPFPEAIHLRPSSSGVMQSPGGSDPLGAALDNVATGELRRALDVLLKVRRPSTEVETLIRLLGEP